MKSPSIFTFLLCIISCLALSNLSAAPLPLKVFCVQGKSGYIPPGSTTWAPVQVNQDVQADGTIKTWADGKVAVNMGDQGGFRVLNKTKVKLGAIAADSTHREGSFDIEKGSILLSLNPSDLTSDFKIKTPNGVAAARGTTFMAGAEGVTVLEGSVSVLQNNKKVIVTSGYTLTKEGKLVIDRDLLGKLLYDFEQIHKGGSILRETYRKVRRAVQIACNFHPLKSHSS